MKTIITTASALALAVGLLGSAPAQAALFDFSFLTATGDTGSGQFSTTSGPSPFLITGITGQFDGFAITGLSFYAGADQLLSYPGPIYADVGGISFSAANGNDYNLTNFGFPQGINYSNLDPGGDGSAVIELLTFDVTEVPEPASMALLGMGLAGLGLIRRRRG